MYELRVCSVCGATELKRIGVENKDGVSFGVYKCLSCDASLSAYSNAIKEANAASKKLQDSINSSRASIVNVAADVYKKAIGSTLSLVSKMKDGLMSGTGTVISKNGYFITNAHVVSEISKDRKKILNLGEFVYGQSGEKNHKFFADIVFVNLELDLALLKTEQNEALVPVEFSEREAFPGEAVYAIGNSKGEGLCIVEGIVSDIHRKIGKIDAVMVSAPVTNGNSGGPVFDSEGKLIGIVQSGKAGVSAMNYAISIKDISEFLNLAKKKENCDF